MGKLLSSLSSAISGAGTNSSVPHPPQMPVDPQVQMAQMQMPGMTPASHGISLADLAAPQASPQPSQPPQMPDNPYTPYDNSQAPAAAAVGTPEQGVTITGDDWHPKQESLLGKIGDLMFGGETFRKRTDQANLESALQGFQKDPQTAIARVRQIDPDFAWKMYEGQAGVDATKALEEQRVQARQDQGRDRLGNMLGAMADKPNAEAIYTKQLPMYNAYAKEYGLPPLPDKYDADAVEAYRNQGISGYDQARLKQQASDQQSRNNYRSTEIQLSKIGKQIDMGNLNERVANDRKVESRLDKSQVLAAREQASKEGISKDADGNPVGMGVTLDSFFAPYVNMKRGQYVVSPDHTQVLMRRADGYLYKYPLERHEDGTPYIDFGNPIIRGTTVDGYLSK